jgi:hypothetical protein
VRGNQAALVIKISVRFNMQRKVYSWDGARRCTICDSVIVRSARRPEGGKPMRIHNIYADENGETHFRDIEIEWSETGPDGTTSKRFPATGIIFRTTPEDWFFFDGHPATRRSARTLRMTKLRQPSHANGFRFLPNAFWFFVGFFICGA